MQSSRSIDGAYDLGRLAGMLRSGSAADCFYDPGSDPVRRAAWMRGFSDGRVALAALLLRTSDQPSPSDLTLEAP